MPQVAIFLAPAEVPPISTPSGSYHKEAGAGERMPCSAGVCGDDEEHFRVLGVLSLFGQLRICSVCCIHVEGDRGLGGDIYK